MTGNLNRYTHLLGRILMSLIFVYTGFNKIAHWPMTAAHMAAAHVPMVPLALALAILIELGGGLAILIGYRTRLAALALFLYLIPVTLLFHNFWAYQGGAQQQQLLNFLKNLAILGGLLRLASDGAGALSLDARRLRAAAGVR